VWTRLLILSGSIGFCRRPEGPNICGQQRLEGQAFALFPGLTSYLPIRVDFGEGEGEGDGSVSIGVNAWASQASIITDTRAPLYSLLL